MTGMTAVAARRTAAACVLALVAVTGWAANKGMPPEAVGGADHPLVQRYSGSTLVGFRAIQWEQTAVPVAMTSDRNPEMAKLEGRLTRLFYLSPPGKSPLEVHRNYEQALLKAGLKKKFACSTDCANLYFAWTKAAEIERAVVWSTGSIPDKTGSSFPIGGVIGHDRGQLLYGTIPAGTNDMHVLLYTSSAGSADTDLVGTYIEIVEPKGMATGQVTVDAVSAKDLRAGLQADGKIALYGVYFDTGKADLKSESKAQIDEMAKLLKTTQGLKVYIVGHTDNQGALDSNLALSQQRAQAVAAALTAAPYKVNANRLEARGVASLVPVASNAAEDGRAKNRRVELVVQ